MSGGGGGDQEVRQNSEPFAQQLPFVQQSFRLADARRQSLSPGFTIGTGAHVGINGRLTGASSIGAATTGNGILPGQQVDLGIDINGRHGHVPTPSTGIGQSVGGSDGFRQFRPSPGQLQNGNAATAGQAAQIRSNRFTDFFNQRATDNGLPTLQFFPGETVTDQSTDTAIGQLLARGGASNIAGTNERASGALNRLLRNPDPANDPTIEAFAQAATRPLAGQRDAALRNEDDRAIAQGAFGGTRQTLARGQINNDFHSAVGDTRARIFNNAFNTQTAQQGQALGLVPSLNEQQTQPAEVYSRIGAQNEQYLQQVINAERERFEFEQSAPDLAINQFANSVNQFSGPTSSSQRVTANGSPIGAVAGGALTGFAARSLFGGGGG